VLIPYGRNFQKCAIASNDIIPGEGGGVSPFSGQLLEIK